MADDINLKSIIGPKPYRQLVFDQQSGKPIDYRDLLKNRISPEGTDSGTSSQTTIDSNAANSSSTTTNIYNPLLATLSVTGSLFGAFGDGADGDLSLGSNTEIALQDASVVKHYNNLTLNGYTLSIAEGQSMAVIFVNGTLSLGTNGVIKHSGNPYHTLNKTSTQLYGVPAAGVPGGLGGAGGKPGGLLLVFARTITGSGTIHTDGAAGLTGANTIVDAGGGNFGGLAGTSGLRATNLWGRNITQTGLTYPTAAPSTSTGGAGGLPETSVGSAPNYDYFSVWYRNPAHLLSFTNTYLAGDSAPSSIETSNAVPHLFCHGTGGQSGGAASGGSTRAASHSGGGGGGGAGGTFFQSKFGGAGGAGGSGGSGYDDQNAPFTSWYNSTGGGGGGGGGTGGICIVRCAANSTTALVVRSSGGAGGPGAAGALVLGGLADAGTAGATWGNGGGSGGGGAGGIALYDGPSSAGLSVLAAGGVAGAVGVPASAGGGSGGDGVAGSAGATGYAYNCSYTFSIALV